MNQISWRGFAALFCLSALLACSDGAQFKSVDITGANYGKDFSLVDQAGARRTLKDYRGKAVLLFFGFTHCPDVCPTTMVTLNEALKKLGADAQRVQVLFVTVDPERDTSAVLAQYVPAFNPTFVGLTGTPAEIAATAAEFKVFFQKAPGTTPDAYSVDHSSGLYLFDPTGRLRLFARYGEKADVIAADVKQLLKS